MLDDRTAMRADLDEQNFRLWNNASNRFGWESYTGLTIGSAEIVSLAAPGRCEDLAGLPPTWIGVGTLDLFHEECMAYAHGLQAAGVACNTEVVEGAFHGFDALTKAPVVRRFRQAQMASLASALGCAEAGRGR
jgi:acetyl esterase/lipase